MNKITRRTKRRQIYAFVALVLNSMNVHADPVADCNHGATAARQIRSCTEVIGRTMLPEGSSTAYMNRALAYLAQRNTSKALADFKASVYANPANNFTYYNRGNMYFDMRKYAEADSDYSKAIELQPDMTPALLNRAMVREQVGNRGGSIADYRAALTLDPMLLTAVAGLKRLGAWL